MSDTEAFSQDVVFLCEEILLRVLAAAAWSAPLALCPSPILSKRPRETATHLEEDTSTRQKVLDTVDESMPSVYDTLFAPSEGCAARQPLTARGTRVTEEPPAHLAETCPRRTHGRTAFTAMRTAFTAMRTAFTAMCTAFTAMCTAFTAVFTPV